MGSEMCIRDRFKISGSGPVRHSQYTIVSTVRKVGSVLDRYAVPAVRNRGPRCCLGCYTMPYLRRCVLCTVCLYVLCTAVYVFCMCCVDMLCIRVFLLVRVRYFGNLFGISTNEAQFS